MMASVVHTVLLFISLSCLSVRGQFVPASPCPQVFQYSWDGSQWTGLMQAQGPGPGVALLIVLKMTILTRLPSQYYGRIEVVGSKTEVLEQLRNGWSIQYRVHFPVPSPLPEVTDITLNGRQICQGQQIFPGPGQYATNINLDYKLSASPHGPSPSYQQQNNQLFQQNNQPFQQNNQPFQQNNQPSQQNKQPFQQDSQSLYNTNSQQNNGQFGNNQDFDGISVITINDGEDSNLNFNNAGQTGQPNNFQQQNPGSNYNRPRPTTFAPPTSTERPTPRPTRPTVFGEQPQCGVALTSVNTLVLGGQKTTRGEWPWLAAIFIKAQSTKDISLTFQCGGSVVSDRHIVTAAHCMYHQAASLSSSALVLKLGAHNLQDWADEYTTTVNVLNIIKHPSYADKPTFLNDIAVLVVKPIVFSDYIIPICLWDDDPDLSKVIGLKGAVLGWGRDENGLTVTPEPRLAAIPIVSQETCKSSHPVFHRITSDNTFCAGDRQGTTGPCNGDSGSGFYLRRGNRWSLRGIVSVSVPDVLDKTCDLKQYVVFTDAAKMSPWIQQTISQA